jgi:hypothetical protein
MELEQTLNTPVVGNHGIGYQPGAWIVQRKKRSSMKKHPRPRVALRLSKARLAEMIEQATVDTYGDSEMAASWFTMLDEHVELPFETQVLGIASALRASTFATTGRSSRSARRTRAPGGLLVDLPLPSPPPGGTEWIDAYRRWRGRG